MSEENKTEGKTRQDPLAPWMPSILESFMKPTIQKILAEYEITSFAALHTQFREDTGSCVSPARFKEWCNTLGFRFERTLTITGDTSSNEPASSNDEMID